MPEFEVTFEVFCHECGNGLCNESVTGCTPGRGELYVQVTPCPYCMESVRDIAFEKGREKGWNDGYDCGLENGECRA